MTDPLSELQRLGQEYDLMTAAMEVARAQALEEAARVADGHVVDTDLHEPGSAFDAGCSWRAKCIATAIRQLIKGGEE